MDHHSTKLTAFKSLDSFFIALAGFLLILIYTQHSGIGVSPDSIVYLSVARNLSATGAMIDYNFKSLVDFPVFYPCFLSFSGLFSGNDILAIAPYLNAFLFAGIIIISGHLLADFKGITRLYSTIVLFSIAISPALMEIYSMLWSETLFIFISLLFILFFSRYLKERSVSSLLICASLAGIACIVRYAGITIIATGLMMLCFDRSLELKKRITHLLIFAVVSFLPLLANLLRNRLKAGLMTGPRESGITPLKDNIYYYGSVVCQWLGIPAVSITIVACIVISLFLIAVILFTKRAWSGKNYGGTENCFTALFIVYTVFILGISTLSHFEQINNRLIAPLFIPLVIVLTGWMPRILQQPAGRYRSALLFLCAAVMLNFEFIQLIKLKEMYTEARTYGIAGYTDDSWKRSELSGFLRKHAIILNTNRRLFSNAHEAAYFNGNVQAESLPHIIDEKDVLSFFSKKDKYIIWFDAITDDELISLQTIRKHADVQKKYNFKDGSIYLVRPYAADSTTVKF